MRARVSRCFHPVLCARRGRLRAARAAGGDSSRAVSPEQAAATAPASTDSRAKERQKQTSKASTASSGRSSTENCVPCHGYKKQKNGLNLESFESAASLTDEHERWAEVVKKLARPRDAARGRAAAARAPATGGGRLAGQGARSHRQADAAGSRARHGATAESHRIQQHGPGSARRRHCIRPTTFRRTMPGTGSTILRTCCRCRRC